MSSQTPQTNLSLERFRLHGMIVACVVYGMYLLLTVQALMALMRRQRRGGKFAEHRLALLFYVFITFVLGTIGIAMDIKFTQIIWIDNRDAPGGPVALIKNQMSHRINFIALATGHIQEWFMQALLVHRCSAIWNRSRRVMVPMITLYLVMIGLSIAVLFQAGANRSYYNNIIELAYLCTEVGHTVLYTILVTNRLFVMRSRMKQIIAQYDSSTYNTIALMVIESAALYAVFATVFIVSFAMYVNGVTILCFLTISKIQGIAQLLIIIRVARGRAVTSEWSTRGTVIPTPIAFAGTASDTTEETDNNQTAGPERGVTVVQTYADSDKTAEVSV